MFFFIFGLNKKQLGKETIQVPKNGFQVNAIVTIYRRYFELFFIPLIPLGKVTAYTSRTLMNISNKAPFQTCRRSIWSGVKRWGGGIS